MVPYRLGIECGAITYQLCKSLRITADAQAQTS